MTRRKVAVLAFLTVAITLATSTTVASAAADPAPTRLKRALSGVGFADRTEWASWRGEPVKVSETWNDPKDAQGRLTWPNMNQLWTVKDYYSGGKWTETLSIAQPMFASDQNVRECATDEQITTWAGLLVEAWKPDAYIRLGWEFNGDWYSWKMSPGDGPAFVSCWRKWYRNIKAVSPDFRLVWNPNYESSNGSLDERTFWPGAEYVDAAGPDYYAIKDGDRLRDKNRTGPNGEPLGIEAWRSWVAAQGVPFAVPEWGIRDQTWGWTGADFLDQLRTAFQTAASSPAGLGYESYFDGGTTFGCQFSIHDAECGYDRHPAAAARYAELWREPYRTDGPPPTDPPPGDGAELIRGLASGRCLTAPATNGPRATIQDCADQRWTRTASGELRSGNRCLDVVGEATADGTPIAMWSCTGGANQRWNVQPDGTVRSAQSGKCLDVAGQLTAAGSPVHLWTCVGQNNQKWTFLGGA